MGAPTFGQKPGGGGGGTSNHHLLSHLTDFDDHTQYLFLGGRSGTNNDALFSTTTDGTFIGSSAINKGVVFNANSSSTLRASQSIFFNKNVTTIDAIDLVIGSAPHVFEMGQNLTWDSTSGTPCALVYFEFASQDTTVWDVIGAGGLLGIFGMLIQPNIQGEIGSGQMLLGFSELLDFEPIITSRGPGATAGDFGGLFVGKSDMIFQALNPGDTLAVVDAGNMTHQVRLGGDGDVTLATNFMLTHRGAVTAGGGGSSTVDKDAALWIPDLGESTLVGATVHASAWIEDARRHFRHAGAGIFGSSATPEAESVLELVSTPGTPRAFIAPRMDNTDEGGFSSPVNGMIIYNTSTDKFRGRSAGAWVDLN